MPVDGLVAEGGLGGVRLLSMTYFMIGTSGLSKIIL